MDKPYSAVRYDRNMSSPRKPRLSRRDWIQAAVELGAEVGFDKIAVEVLAARIGATRGSFYWHFADRADLISAVLKSWEEEGAQMPIAALASLPSDEVMPVLMDIAFGGSAAEDAAEWRLIAASEDPMIAPVAARIHSTRREFIATALAEQGLSPEAADERSRVIYAAYLGRLALRHLDPESPDIADALRALFS